MATPTVPRTPSKTINDMLQARCGKEHDNPIKMVLATFVCHVFTAITRVYRLISGEVQSHRMWMLSCVLVALGGIFLTYAGYHVILFVTYLVETTAFYGGYMVALLTIALAVSGMVFFDKNGDASPGSPSFESKRE